MKKIIVSLFCCCMLLGLTGCGSKQETLKCTKDAGDEKGTLIGTFKDSKLTKIVIESSTKFDSAEDLDNMYGLLQLTVGVMTAKEGVEATLDKDDLTAKMKITADLTKMSSDDKNEMFDKEILNKEDFKAYAQEDNFTCK